MGDPPFQVDQEFVEAHGAWMLALATRLLQDPQLAEDAVQDALLAAHGAATSFEGRAGLQTWLYRITVNAALAIRRKQDPQVQDIDALQPQFDDRDCRIEAPWAQPPLTESLLEQAELRAIVREAVEQLPESYRICLQLRDFEELPVREVAAILEISEQNVKVRTHRARSALKSLLEPMLRGEPVTELAAQVPAATPGQSRARRLKGLMLNNLPLMMTCAEFEQFMADYLDGTLASFRRVLFEFHIRTCRECREYLAAYQQARQIAAGSFRAPMDLAQVPEDLLAAILKASRG